MAANTNDSDSRAPGPGGFLLPSLPSPAPSAASTTGSARSRLGLPHPRSQTLRPGSAKQEMVRRFAMDRLELINRRFVKKLGEETFDNEGVVGYKSMGELCKDLDGLIDILWATGTPSLQIPFFLRIACEFNTWIVGLPPSPTATFSILRKLDHCFASLASGEDIDTKEPLPGFESSPQRPGMSQTEMVRCRSTLQETRVLIVEVLNKEPYEEEDAAREDGHQADDRSEADGPDDDMWDDETERLHMGLAQVYEYTLVKLGEMLGDEGEIGAIHVSDLCSRTNDTDISVQGPATLGRLP